MEKCNGSQTWYHPLYNLPPAYGTIFMNLPLPINSSLPFCYSPKEFSSLYYSTTFGDIWLIKIECLSSSEECSKITGSLLPSIFHPSETIKPKNLAWIWRVHKTCVPQYFADCQKHQRVLRLILALIDQI